MSVLVTRRSSCDYGTCLWIVIKTQTRPFDRAPNTVPGQQRMLSADGGKQASVLSVSPLPGYDLEWDGWSCIPTPITCWAHDRHSVNIYEWLNGWTMRFFWTWTTFSHIIDHPFMWDSWFNNISLEKCKSLDWTMDKGWWHGTRCPAELVPPTPPTSSPSSSPSSSCTLCHFPTPVPWPLVACARAVPLHAKAPPVPHPRLTDQTLKLLPILQTPVRCHFFQ